MYPPSMLAASSVCAAFSGLATEEQKNLWTRTRLVSFLQGLTNIEPVRKRKMLQSKQTGLINSRGGAETRDPLLQISPGAVFRDSRKGKKFSEECAIPISRTPDLSNVPITRAKSRFKAWIHYPDITNSWFVEPIFVLLASSRNCKIGIPLQLWHCQNNYRKPFPITSGNYLLIKRNMGFFIDLSSHSFPISVHFSFAITL